MKVSFTIFKIFLHGNKEGLAKMMANPLNTNSFIGDEGTESNCRHGGFQSVLGFFTAFYFSPRCCF